MKLLNTLLIFIIIVCLTFKSKAQSKYNDLLLVPYNSNDKWGFSDTLGNIIIQPKFSSVGFFKSVNENIIAAEVFTSYGRNYILPNGNLLAPLKSSCEETNDINDILLLQDRNGSTKLYSISKQKIVKDIKFDTLISFGPYERLNYLLIKKNKDKTFKKLNLKSGEISLTDFISIETLRNKELFFGSEFKTRVATNLNGEKIELTREKDIILSEKEYLSLKKADINANADDNSQNNFPPNSVINPSSKKDTIEFISGYRREYTNKNYKFKSLYFLRENNLYGIINENKEIILPANYDNITVFNRNSMALLRKGNKLGIKVFFTHYGTIEPKYEKIDLNIHSFNVKKNWNFSLFEIVYKGKKGYIGENGVEYFNFD